MTEPNRLPVVETKKISDSLGRSAIERWENEGGELIVPGLPEPDALGDLSTFLVEPVKGFESRIPISGRSKFLTDCQ